MDHPEEPAIRQRWRTPRGALVFLLHQRLLRRTLLTAVVVGTILSLINQGHIVFAGEVTLGTWARIAANYLMPFLVSNIGALAATHR